MRLRYAGTCVRCGTALPAGTRADYDKGARTVACIGCAPTETHMTPQDAAHTPGALTVGASMDPPPDGVPPVTFSSGPVEVGAAPDQTLDVIDGTAGGSALREFDRRHAARQQRVQSAHPRIGKFLLAVFDDPQSTRAWDSGAKGEQRMGTLLQEIAGPDLRVLHDRRIPRSRANIDHLVVCPSGVFVIDAKRYRNARPQLRVEGGILRPRRALLYVGGRDRTQLVDGMDKQLGLVRTALADQPDVPVRGVLCFIEADWPLIGGAFSVRGIDVLWPRKLPPLLTQPGFLDADRIAALQWQLHEAFPRQNAERRDRAG